MFFPSIDPHLQPSSNLAASHTTEPQVRLRQLVPEMAVDRADKENLPPTTATAAAAAAAVARLHGVPVRRCKLKRLAKARRRVPLRDITNLFVVESAVAADWQRALPQQPQERSEPKSAPLPAQNGLAGGAAKLGRYSLRKEFR